MNISQATSFIKNAVSTGKDFGSVEQKRTEAERVDKALEKVQADTVDIRKELSQLEKDAEIKPPSFKDVSNGQLVTATTSAGAVLGGLGGIVSALGAGPAQVTFNEVTHPVLETKLDGPGFNYNNVPVDVDASGRPRGWDIDISRRALINEKVGEYTTREPVGSSTSSVLLSGAIGLGVGAAAGAGIGLLGIGLRKVLKQEYNDAKPRQTEGDTKVLITSGAVGAAVGAVAGGLSSVIQSHTVSYQTQSVQMENKVIGHIPHGANETNGGFWVPNTNGNQPPSSSDQIQRWMNGNHNKLERDGFRGLEGLRPDEVRGDVPRRGLLGGLKIDTETRQTSVGPSLVASVAGGAVIGGVTGVAGGVLLNVLRKTL